MSFHLASSSALKAKAVSEALDAKVTVEPQPLHTSLAQPKSLSEAMQCARERVAHCTVDVTKCTVVVVENYISVFNKDWHDSCLVVMHAFGLSWHYCIGEEVIYIPARYSQAIANMDATLTTAGDIIAGDLGCDPTDWFGSIQGYKHISRHKQIVDAVRDCARFVAKVKPTVHMNFPSFGVAFKDMFSCRIRDLIRALVQAIEFSLNQQTDDILVFGIDSRGLALGLSIASEMDVQFVPIRKAGKLPGDVLRVEYSKEYGTDTLELQCNLGVKNKVCVVIDDLIATGGSMRAACDLVKEAYRPNRILALTLFDVADLRDTWKKVMMPYETVVCFPTAE